ncbi:MAG: SAM-dependent methyltransferase, partial [Pseudomonadota bacterium]
MKCRFCKSPLKLELIDLVNCPPSNSYLSKEQLNLPEVYYPLKVLVCTNCWLAQVGEFKKHNEIFNQDYAYFSSFSTSWLTHCKQYVSMIIERLRLDKSSSVMEIASNDGYLLQYFQENKIKCIGIEPTE